ncbi:alpha/beta fold hydrolase [Nonomuraea sp. GTA35]|uniref:alpha/beta fold hydrolase n=1 Tax=Nonomuraea sp. GTA35 TaxID=1676746 RepID=UPI0035C10093
MRHLGAIVAVAVTTLIVPPAMTPAAGEAASRGSAAASVAWGTCPPVAPGRVRDPRQQCASLRVPLDYRDPRGRTIDIAISRIASAEPATRRGILLSNPGGPGESGLDMPSELAPKLSAEVLDRYDLIGMDPRGIGHSTPVTCALPLDAPDLLIPWPAPDGDISRNVAYTEAAARSCAEHSGDLLPFITTANTARDMDRVRDALGEAKASFYGRSYGSYLGTVYISLFPRRGDRIILDAGVDPRLIWHRQWLTWGPASALRFPDFTGWAAARDDIYHLGATPEAVQQRYIELAAALDARPLPSPVPGFAMLTGNIFRELTREELYFDEAFPLVAQLWQYAAGTAPAPAMRKAAAAPASAVPASGVPADNGLAALFAVVCGDVAWPVDLRAYQREVASDRRAYPLTNGMPANVWPCARWRFRPIEPPVTVTGHGPRNVLILQNLRDPGVPWTSGYGLRTVLDRRAAMVTVDAGSHTAYGRGNACADMAAHGFLVTGRLPRHDRFCPADTGGHAR